MRNEKAEYHLRATGNALQSVAVGVIVVTENMIATWWPDSTPDDVVRQYYDAIKADRIPERFRGKPKT